MFNGSQKNNKDNIRRIILYNIIKNEKNVKKYLTSTLIFAK